MRSGDDEIVAAAQEIIFQYLWQREIEELAVEHRFHFRVAALHRVADHDKIDIVRDVLRPKTFL